MMVPLFDSSNKHDFSLLSLVHDIHQNIFLVWYSMTPPPPDLKKIINFDDLLKIQVKEVKRSDVM